jgi:hypothetical protein
MEFAKSAKVMRRPGQSRSVGLYEDKSQVMPSWKQLE